MSALSLTFSILPFLVAMVFGLLVPFAMVLAYRRFAVGGGLLCLAFGLTSALPGLSHGGLNFGIRLDPTDIVALMLMPVAIARFVIIREARVLLVGFYVLVAVIFLNVVHGLIIYKAAAGAAARPEIYALIAAGYASTFPADRNVVRTLVRLLLLLGSWLALVALYRWVAVGFDVRDMLPASGSFQPRGHSVWRVIISSEALLLAELAVLAWFFSQKGGLLRGWQWVAPILLLMVVVLQHRSTWLSAVAGVAAALAVAHAAGQSARRGAGLLVAAAVFIAAAGFVTRTGEGGLGRDVVRSAADAVELRGTAGERLGSWRQLVQQWAGGSVRGLVVGNPAGTSVARYTSDEIGARRIAYQAHNYYVTLLTSHGLLSLLAFLSMLWPLVHELYKAARQPELNGPAGVLLVLIVCQSAYYLTYGTDYIQWLTLGVGLSMVSMLRRQAAPLNTRPLRALYRPSKWSAR